MSDYATGISWICDWYFVNMLSEMLCGRQSNPSLQTQWIRIIITYLWCKEFEVGHRHRVHQIPVDNKSNFYRVLCERHNIWKGTNCNRKQHPSIRSSPKVMCMLHASVGMGRRVLHHCIYLQTWSLDRGVTYRTWHVAVNLILEQCKMYFYDVMWSYRSIHEY